jgi:hypothetical protein
MPMAIVLGLLVSPLAVPLDKVPAESAKRRAPAKPDPRALKLQRFFTRMHAPVAPLSDAFVRAADENHLDWRLLPSIAVIESSGGKHYLNNNIFGWGGDTAFPSIRAGIQQVADRLGHSPIYKNRSVVGKLKMYNSADADYVSKVLGVMRRISAKTALQTPAPETELAFAN